MYKKEEELLISYNFFSKTLISSFWYVVNNFAHYSISTVEILLRAQMHWAEFISGLHYILPLRSLGNSFHLEIVLIVYARKPPKATDF